MNHDGRGLVCGSSYFMSMLHSGVSGSLGFRVSDKRRQHMLLDFMLGRSRQEIKQRSRVAMDRKSRIRQIRCGMEI